MCWLVYYGFCVVEYEIDVEYDELVLCVDCDGGCIVVVVFC